MIKEDGIKKKKKLTGLESHGGDESAWVTSLLVFDFLILLLLIIYTCLKRRNHRPCQKNKQKENHMR